jgi:hypothetical protein
MRTHPQASRQNFIMGRKLLENANDSSLVKPLKKSSAFILSPSSQGNGSSRDLSNQVTKQQTKKQTNKKPHFFRMLESMWV